MKTDLELQILLAKMLPEKIIAPTPKAITFFWQRTDIDDVDVDVRRIKDTEWLHVCWLIERGVNDEQYMQYTERMFHNSLIERHHMSASWQQRASALIAVKGEK